MEGKFESPIKRRKRVQGKYLDGKNGFTKIGIFKLKQKIDISKKNHA